MYKKEGTGQDLASVFHQYRRILDYEKNLTLIVKIKITNT